MNQTSKDEVTQKREEKKKRVCNTYSFLHTDTESREITKLSLSRERKNRGDDESLDLEIEGRDKEWSHRGGEGGGAIARPVTID